MPVLKREDLAGILTTQTPLDTLDGLAMHVQALTLVVQDQAGLIDVIQARVSQIIREREMERTGRG